MPYPCFLITQTDRAHHELRRASSKDCPIPEHYGRHYAVVPIGIHPLELTPEGFIPSLDLDHADPRWPTACACGYVFDDGDRWDCHQEPIYAAEDGREWTLKTAPAGAMWRATWFEPSYKGPDGICLMVKLPDGMDWAIDGPAGNDRSGRPWDRTGIPPAITASPSILTPGYHGWLQNGALTDDIDRRTY